MTAKVTKTRYTLPGALLATLAGLAGQRSTRGRSKIEKVTVENAE